jgi:hypothetical protein
MPESRTEKRQRQRRERRELREQELRLKRWPSKLWRTTARVGTAFVTIVSAYVLFFQVSASFSPLSQTVLSPSDPFLTQFTFVSDGYSAAHNVRSSCNVSVSLFTTDKFFSYGGDFVKPFPKVRSKDLITVPCSRRMTYSQIKEADIVLIFAFRRSFTFWDAKQTFRYKVAVSPSGETRWLPQPVD